MYVSCLPYVRTLPALCRYPACPMYVPCLPYVRTLPALCTHPDLCTYPALVRGSKYKYFLETIDDDDDDDDA